MEEKIVVCPFCNTTFKIFFLEEEFEIETDCSNKRCGWKLWIPKNGEVRPVNEPIYYNLL